MEFKRALDPAIREVTAKGAVHVLHAGPESLVGPNGDQIVRLFAYICPRCERRSLDVHLGPFDDRMPIERISVVPRGAERPVPDELPSALAEDYREATRVSALSTKGAATLARRCLQALLRHAFPDMPRGELFDEIKWLEENHKLAEPIFSALHALRKVGNFGAHPPKDGTTMVYDLTPDDFEACFALLRLLFDTLIVTPTREARQVEALKARVLGPAPGSAQRRKAT